LALLWATVFGQFGKPDVGGSVIVTATKVTPLSWSAGELTSEAAIVCACGVVCPSGSTITYSWSGLDFRGQAGAQGPTGYAYSPGTYTVTCRVHVVYPNPPGGTFDGSASATCYVFGGPFTATSTRSREAREGLLNPPSSRFQPWILEDYSGGSQDQTLLTLRAATGQPGTATTYAWSKNGTLQFPVGATGSLTFVTAQGCCGRGGSFPIVTYTVTIDGQQYAASDSTDPQYKAISCHRPTYCGFDPVDTVLIASPPGAYINKYYLYITSNIGDPLTLTDFQERYPGPHFAWEGSNAYFGVAPNPGIPPLAANSPHPEDLVPPGDPVPVVAWNGVLDAHWTSGSADRAFPRATNYTYNSKAGPDNVGAVWNIYVGAPGLVLFQFINAATQSTDPADAGIFLREFVLSVWTLGATRQ